MKWLQCNYGIQPSKFKKNRSLQRKTIESSDSEQTRSTLASELQNLPSAVTLQTMDEVEPLENDSESYALVTFYQA